MKLLHHRKLAASDMQDTMLSNMRDASLIHYIFRFFHSAFSICKHEFVTILQKHTIPSFSRGFFPKLILINSPPL